MDKKCSICGNIYKNRTFRGGFICKDCVDYIKRIDLSQLLVSSGHKKSLITHKRPAISL